MDIDKVIAQNDSFQKALSHLKAQVKSNRLWLEMYRDAGKEFATNNLFSDDSFKSLSKGAYKLIHGFGTSVNFDELHFRKDLGLKSVNSFTSDYLVPKFDIPFKSQFNCLGFTLSLITVQR